VLTQPQLSTTQQSIFNTNIPTLIFPIQNYATAASKTKTKPVKKSVSKAKTPKKNQVKKPTAQKKEKEKEKAAKEKTKAKAVKDKTKVKDAVQKEKEKLKEQRERERVRIEKVKAETKARLVKAHEVKNARVNRLMEENKNLHLQVQLQSKRKTSAPFGRFYLTVKNLAPEEILNKWNEMSIEKRNHFKKHQGVTPFSNFIKAKFKDTKAKDPSLKPTDVIKALSIEWKSLPDASKNQFKALSA